MPTIRPFVAFLALSACTEPTTDALSPCGVWSEGAGSPHTRPQPVAASAALLPWPSDHYLVADESTRTGCRIAFDDELLQGPVTSAMVHGHDGFSRVTPIVTAFPQKVAPSSYPDQDDWLATTRPDSPVHLVDLLTGELHAALVEPDLLADAGDPQALIIRPHDPLEASTPYAVLIHDTLQGEEGALTATGAFAAVRDGTHVPEQQWLADHLEPVFAASEALGRPRSGLVQAWRFTTRSHEQVTGTSIDLQQQAGAAPVDDFTITEVVSEADRTLVRGTFAVPQFLGDDLRIVRDEQGHGIAQGIEQAPFLLTLPRTQAAPTAPILFGHGFFSSLEEPTWGNLFGGLEQWQRGAATTTFQGFSEDDFLDAAAILGGRLEDLDTLIDQQLQSHVRFTVLHRLLRGGLADAVEVDHGDGPFQPLTSEPSPYLGISNGGTQGLVLMATSPSLSRGALVVAGGGWSHMLQRAQQWNTLGTLYAGSFDSDLDMQVGIALLQQVFDPVDSLNYAEHLISHPLPDTAAAKELLLVEALDDSQVSNLVTRWVARAGNFPQVLPTIEQVQGLPTLDGSTGRELGPVGYIQFDLGYEPAPSGNMPPAEENDAHAHVRLLPTYKAQMGHFLQTGAVYNPCDGACTPDAEVVSSPVP